MQILLLFLALSLQQEWKLDSTTTVFQADDGWTFRVEGTSNFPDGTVLRGRVYALYETPDLEKGGTKIETEPFFYGPKAWQNGVVKEGRFSLDVYSFIRRPYSLPYRLQLLYEARLQPQEVREKVGTMSIERTFDFRKRDEEALSEEMKQSANRLHAEFLQVRKLFSELKEVFTRFRNEKSPEKKAWRVWLDPWMDRVDELRVSNDDRLDLWTLWIERQGKFRIEGFCSRLPDMASDCQDILFGQEELLPRMQYKMRAFLDYYEEAIEVVGLNMPLDLETIAPALRKFEEVMKRLDSFDPATWKKDREGIKPSASKALLAIAGSFGNRKRGYYLANQMMVSFRNVLEKADSAKEATDSQLKEARKTLAEKVSAFRTYAGIQ